MKRTKLVAILLCVVFLLSFQAFADEKKVKMGIATVSWKTDMSWGASMEETANHIKKKYPHVDVTFVDALPWGDFPSWLQLQCESGTKLFFLDSNSTWFEALQEVAPKYPDVWFVTGGGGLEINEKLPGNVTVYMVSQEEGEYVAGVVSGLMTKSNKIGFVSAFDYPAIVANWKAWELGAKYSNPDVEVIVAYTGAWGDAEKHYETTRAVINQGIDILNHDLDSLGFLKAAKESGTKVIGAHRDQSALAPELFLTSALIMHEEMGELTLKDYMAGALTKKGKKLGLKDGYDTTVALTNVSDDVRKKAEEVKGKIRAGEIVVPLIFKAK
jgi:basic membrane protein A